MMTSIDEEKELSDFHEAEKRKKIAYCLSVGLTCETCPPDRAGCPYAPKHIEAIKEEKLWPLD
jgi:hypothetical protein